MEFGQCIQGQKFFWTRQFLHYFIMYFLVRQEFYDLEIIFNIYLPKLASKLSKKSYESLVFSNEQSYVLELFGDWDL